MPHKIEADHPAYGHVTFEIEAETPEKAFSLWKQIVSNPRGWNRLVNNPTVAKAKAAVAGTNAVLDDLDDIGSRFEEKCPNDHIIIKRVYGVPYCNPRCQYNGKECVI